MTTPVPHGIVGADGSIRCGSGFTVTRMGVVTHVRGGRFRVGVRAGLHHGVADVLGDRLPGAVIPAFTYP